ncbi:restriction endonuclease subunit S [Nocardia fusca]|uniref:restriction endonuclease subunit S n=1 Tax=Nocardia fusca TaxID=941183 RepID=UPI0037C9117E
MSNWGPSMPERTVQLSELVDKELLEVGAGRPRSVSADHGPFPILRVADVLDGRIEYAGHTSSGAVDRQRLGPKVSQPGDIVLTVKGTVGRVAIMPPEAQIFAYSPQLCYFRPLAGGPLVPRYLYYWFRSTEFWVQANVVKGQTDMADFISLGDVISLEMRLPSVSEQRSVSELLGALDDKIAVNERIATTADELLRTQFAHFSTESRATVRIGEIGALIRDSVSVAHLSGNENYIGLEHMPRRNMWLSEWNNAAELASAKSTFMENDVLFGKLRPYFHKVGIALTDGICSTDILVVRPKEASYLGWLLLALSSDDMVSHASALSDGTRMPRAKWNDLASYEIPWPEAGRVAQVNGAVRSITERVRAAAAESHTLATLRDTLLPHLMSGRLRVRDAEKIIEDRA